MAESVLTDRYLAVPDLEGLSSFQASAALLTRLGDCGKMQRSFVSTFGLELKGAALCLRNDEAHARTAVARLFARPAMEPLLLTSWAELVAERPGLDALVLLTSKLCNGEATLASSRMRTRGDPEVGTTYYAPRHQQAAWLDLLVQGRERIECPVSQGYFAYCVTILCHPMRDGNGRLARAMMHGAWARARVTAAPVIPLGPAFYQHAGEIGETMYALSETGNWEAAFSWIDGVVSKACDLAEQVARA